MWRAAKFLALGLALAAGACASGPDYQTYLGKWSGASRDKVIAEWGPPDYRYRDHKGRDTLQYIYYERIVLSLASGREIVYWCLTDFHIGAEGMVNGVSIKGNHCFPPDNLAADRAERLGGRRGLPFVPPSNGPRR